MVPFHWKIVVVATHTMRLAMTWTLYCIWLVMLMLMLMGMMEQATGLILRNGGFTSFGFSFGSAIDQHSGPSLMIQGGNENCTSTFPVSPSQRQSRLREFWRRFGKLRTVIPNEGYFDSSSDEQLSSIQLLATGAVSRTISQGLIHPLTTLKTILQLRRNSGSDLLHITQNVRPAQLFQGLDAQILFSIPHGALYYYCIQRLRPLLSERRLYAFPKLNKEFLNDFVTSSAATVLCSVISTPQMVVTDRVAAGTYSSSWTALTTILRNDGIAGLYSGWWPALAQKIPSYG
jgi:hypothetical protein